MTPEITAERISLALTLKVVTDSSDATAIANALALSRKHDLYLYDALYLELALRKSAALAVLDKKLAAAAADEGVQVI